ERRLDRADHAVRREFQPHASAEVLRQPLLDHAGAETALARRHDLGPAALDPAEDQFRRLAFDDPDEVHAPAWLDSAPCFTALVASSCSAIEIASAVFGRFAHGPPRHPRSKKSAADP